MNIKIAQFFCLLLLYLSGNYLVVRELSQELLGLTLSPGENIPFAPHIYVFTIIVPVVYIYTGFVKRFIPLYQAGLLAAAFSVFTFKYYFYHGSDSVFITIIGGILLIIAFGIIRFLRKTPGGYTGKSLLHDTSDVLNLEAFIFAQAGGDREMPHPGGQEFGDGESGGAGAGGHY
jgi:hypothetical protein